MTTEKPDTAADVAAQPPHVAPTRPAPRKATPRKKAAPQRKRTAKAARKKKSSSHPGKSTTDVLLGLLQRANGATVAQMMAATGWQRHSVRGFISLAQSRRGLKITSAKNKAGERVYRVAAKRRSK